MSAVISEVYEDVHERRHVAEESARLVRTPQQTRFAILATSCFVGLILAGGICARKKIAERSQESRPPAVVALPDYLLR